MKAIIITSYIDHPAAIPREELGADLYILADGGYARAEELGILEQTENGFRPLLPQKNSFSGASGQNILPDVLLIGDYDSSEEPDAGHQLLPRVKDVTDTEAALDIAFEKGAGQTVILGGLGGRFDHSLGNLSLLAKYQGRMETEILDGQNRVKLLSPGEYAVPRSRFRFLSFVPYMGRVRGLTLTGVKYPLKDHTLTEGNTLGISNEITGREAKIAFREGILIMIESRDS